MKLFVRLTLLVQAMCLLLMGFVSAADAVTSPKEQFGVNVGDDYQLINYTQLEAYWKKLAKESPRMKLESMGQTAEGRTQWMAVVTAPENFAKLAEYKEASRRLALGEGLNDAEAKALAKTSKAVIWIDGGLHANEIVGAQQLIETSYQMVSLDDAETLRFLKDSIILFVPANPDGMELVSNWYMRNKNPKKRSTDFLPRLYQKYIGHDNNRDFYMVNQPETENMSRIMYREWFPQLMYNHHQRGPGGSVVFVPPFREPPSYNYDPLLILGNQTVGLALQTRLAAEDKAGAVSRSYTGYSTWYNGSLRTTGYYHNQIGMLTEINGHPTPMELSFFPDMLLPSNDHPMPIVPGKWKFRQPIDYSVTLNRAMFDYGSRNRETVLYNRYLMARNAIDRGSRDNWTIQPRKLYEVEKIVASDEKEQRNLKWRRGPGVSKKYIQLFRKPEDRDPQTYVIPAKQKDFPTAVKFLNALIKSGIKVQQATSDFSAGGKQYMAGSYIVSAAQAFRPQIIDMFEPQDHPDEFENGNPVPPYDNAGWTLAFQMGVEFDRLFEKVNGSFKDVEGYAKPLPGKVAAAANATGYLIDHGVNDAAIAVNRLLADGHKVYWLKSTLTANGQTYPQGTIYVAAKSNTESQLREMATTLGVDFDAVENVPSVDALQIQPVKVGLWDRYGGSMPSGWTRWILENFEFPFEVVYPPQMDKGKLNQQYDALLFVNGGIQYSKNGKTQSRRQRKPIDVKAIPRKYRNQIGKVTKEKTLPQLERFVKAGGSLLAIGRSTSVAGYLNLPVGDHLVDGNGKHLSEKDFYVPSSVLQVRVDNTRPVAYGITERLDVLMDESPVMRLSANADKQGVNSIAWFDSNTPLRSGWAWNQNRLYGGTAVAQAKLGKGSVYLYGPEVLFRGQSHAAYQLVFNAIYLSNAKPVRLGDKH